MGPNTNCESRWSGSMKHLSVGEQQYHTEHIIDIHLFHPVYNNAVYYFILKLIENYWWQLPKIFNEMMINGIS